MIAATDTNIMMIGQFARNILVEDGQADTSSGGGVYYGSIALRSIGANVAVVTRLHTKDFPRLEELKREGVQVFAAPAPVLD